jgi:iron complex transport system substrate-binding protein
MTRKAQVILATAVCLLALAGAGWLALRGQVGLNVDTQTWREVTDMTGRALRLPPRPEHVLSLCTSATDAVAALHEESRLAAIDEYSRVVDGTDKAAVIGKGSAISKEQVLALKIDLAFVWWYQDDVAAMVEGLGVPVVRIRSGRASEVPSTIRLVGDCLGCRPKADALALSVEEFLRQASSRPAQAARPVVYLELYSPFKTVGRDSYMNDLLELAGGTNIARDVAGTVVLSAERLMQADPDVILFVDGFATTQAISERPGISGLNAAKMGRIHAVDRRWLVAGPGLPVAVERLREAIIGPSHERQ